VSIDPSVAGRRYVAPAPYEVGREKIREFAFAVGDDHPAYLDAAAAASLGHPDVIAPPTFASVVTLDAWARVLDDLGVEFSNVLHIDQRFAVTRPIRAGDVIAVETLLEEVRERMGATWLTLRTDLATDAGEHLCTATSTIMVRPAGDE
jgi:acyl dehydratase